VSAKGIGMGARTATALLLAATAAGALAACGHYGPPLRAAEYREKEAAEAAAERQRAQGATPNDETPTDPDGGPPAPGTGELEGLEAP
jgi:hypothetical protein